VCTGHWSTYFVCTEFFFYRAKSTIHCSISHPFLSTHIYSHGSHDHPAHEPISLFWSVLNALFSGIYFLPRNLLRLAHDQVGDPSGHPLIAPSLPSTVFWTLQRFCAVMLGCEGHTCKQHGSDVFHTCSRNVLGRLEARLEERPGPGGMDELRAHSAQGQQILPHPVLQAQAQALNEPRQRHP